MKEIVLSKDEYIDGKVYEKGTKFGVVEESNLKEEVMPVIRSVTSHINDNLKIDRSESAIQTTITELAGAIRVGVKNSRLPKQYYDEFSNYMQGI